MSAGCWFALTPAAQQESSKDAHVALQHVQLREDAAPLPDLTSLASSLSSCHSWTPRFPCSASKANLA